MTNIRKTTLKFISTMVFAMTTLSANSALLLNGDFEASDLGGWSATPTANVTGTNAINGNQSMLLDSTGVGTGGFIVAFQTIALNGTNFLVGDEIYLSGLTKFLSTQGNLGRVFVEVAFRNGGTEDVLGEVGDIDFSGSVFTELFAFDGLTQMFTSPSIIIPDIITSLNGVTAQTTGIRIALAIGAIEDGDETTQVLFDDITLNKVTQVSSPNMIAALGLLIFVGAFRSRVNK